MTTAPDFLQVIGGKVRFNLHRNQLRAWDSKRRFVVVCAGNQSGKTVTGPPWLHREIKTCGPGDYLVVAPTYKLLNKKALPQFLQLFETLLKLGRYNKSEHVFNVSPEGEEKLFGSRQDTPTVIFFGYAEDPESLESATAKAAWLDEAGQRKFKLASWQAILRRLGIHEGRVLITTTPYDLGWLKAKLYDLWRSGSELVEWVNFESKDNPTFPLSEWNRAKADLPTWKFDLMYRGILTMPAGVIYDNFDADRDVITPFHINKTWDRFIGLDFGGVNTTALFYAKPPSQKTYYLYREYKAGYRTAAQHAREILAGEPYPFLAAGGSKSEDQWRDEFAEAGLGIEAPDFTDVEVGIDRVYGFHARQEVRVFDTCEGYLEEKATYRRKLDANDQVTADIEDKSSFHFMDAERYILSKLAEPMEAPAEQEFDFDEFGGFVL